MKIGIYEQIINQLFEEKISSIDQKRFYIGERVIKKNEVAKLLSPKVIMLIVGESLYQGRYTIMAPTIGLPR